MGFSRDPETGRAVRDTPQDAPWEVPPGSWLKHRQPMWRSWAAREKGAYAEARSKGATPEEAERIAEAAARAAAVAEDPEGWL